MLLWSSQKCVQAVNTGGNGMRKKMGNVGIQVVINMVLVRGSFPVAVLVENSCVL